MKRLADILEWVEPLRVQFAIKLTLAGLITYYLANWMRLEEPGWGVATCVVLVMAKHVGAIGEKAILRTLGNFIGGAVGVLLIGNFADNGLALMGGFFIITAFCSWRYGGTGHPYAFLLAAVTLNRIVVPNFNTPDAAWETATNRVLEITLGILVSTIVYSVLWPRYARVEFLDETRDSLRDLAASLRGHANETAYAKVILQSNNRLTKLRKLLDSGARESAYFRHHFEVYAELTNKINSLYVFAGTVIRDGETSTPDDPAERLIHRLNQLAGERMEAIRTSDLAASRQRRTEFRRLLNELRTELQNRLIPPSDATNHYSGIYLTLKHLHSQLRQVGELHDFLQNNPNRTLRFPFIPRGKVPGYPTDPFWIRNAIKSTTAGCVAWFLCNWINPPGATFIPYLVWYFTLMSRQFQENNGDRGIFQFAFLNTLIGLVYVAFAFLVTPMLASYSVMNLTLGAILLLYGYLTANFAGWSRFSRMGFFVILSWLGLNAQSPVGAQAILDSYLQVILGLWFAALVDRVWWPILPQWEVCSRLANYFGNGARYLRDPISPHRLRWLQQMALLVNEAAGWAHQLKSPEFSMGESDRWLNVLTALRVSTYRLRLLVFLAKRNRALLRETQVPVTEFHRELLNYYEKWQAVFRERGRREKPHLAALEASYRTLAALTGETATPAQRLLFNGLVATANNLLIALRRFESEIAPIPLPDYHLDRSL